MLNGKILGIHCKLLFHLLIEYGLVQVEKPSSSSYKSMES